MNGAAGAFLALSEQEKRDVFEAAARRLDALPSGKVPREAHGCGPAPGLPAPATTIATTTHHSSSSPTTTHSTSSSWSLAYSSQTYPSPSASYSSGTRKSGNPPPSLNGRGER